jgi:diguanylate cyclase (GGDEF)-like protein
MQIDMRTVFVLLVGLYACLGFVCLFLPYRVPGSRAVTYWGCGMLLLAAGTGGIGLRGIVPDIVSIALANALLLLAFMFMRDSAQGGGRLRSDWSGWSVAGAAILLLLYFTAVQPDTRIRIMVFSLSAAVLAVRPALALIAAVPKDARRARRFTSACFLGIGLVMLARAVFSTNWGANADVLSPGAVQAETILLVGLFVVASTLGVVWIEIEQLQGDLTRLAMLDPLTGTLNRRAFMRAYELELSRSIRDKTGFALALFDLDNFKTVNDTHGHAIGDQVLCRAVDTLRVNLRGHDVLARYGGEEFALLIPGADKAAAMLAAERARLTVGARPIEVGQISIPITVSAGVAAYGVDGSDWESLLSGADKALYEAKHGGKDRVVGARGSA